MTRTMTRTLLRVSYTWRDVRRSSSIDILGDMWRPHRLFSALLRSDVRREIIQGSNAKFDVGLPLRDFRTQRRQKESRPE